MLISNKTAVSTRWYEHWVNIYQTVFCTLTSLYFVTIHCVNVRLITWNPDLLAWRISILKYIGVIIHCTLWSPFENFQAFIFLLSPSTKGNHFLSYWCVTWCVSLCFMSVYNTGLNLESILNIPASFETYPIFRCLLFPKSNLIYLYNSHCSCSVLISSIIFSLHLGWYAICRGTFDVPVDIIRECWRAKWWTFFIQNQFSHQAILSHRVVP